MPDTWTLGALLTLALLLGLVIPFRRRREHVIQTQLAMLGHLVEGRVIEFGLSEDGWKLTYEFTPESSAHEVTCTEFLLKQPPEYMQVGARINVRYLPEKPWVARFMYG